ncbi:MAG TPA: hypothetical protein VMJ10_10215 [Kofleriaceae bacterium]|nr:hypothetical protein [Kofleriaceae bacterium]
MQANQFDNSTGFARVRVSPSIAPIPVVMALGTVLALVAFLALPWVDDISMRQILANHDHGYQLAYVLIGAELVALCIAAASFTRSRRWLTAPAAVLLLIPTFLSAVVHHGQLGAHLAALGSLVALVAAVILTIKPARS